VGFEIDKRDVGCRASRGGSSTDFGRWNARFARYRKRGEIVADDMIVVDLVLVVSEKNWFGGAPNPGLGLASSGRSNRDRAVGIAL